MDVIPEYKKTYDFLSFFPLWMRLERLMAKPTKSENNDKP